MLTAMGALSREVTEGGVFCGELSLTGELKPLTGVVAHALHALTSGAKRIFVPACNAAEAAMVGELTVIPVESLADLLLILKGQKTPEQPEKFDETNGDVEGVGISEVVGQVVAKEALIVAAAGGHNMLMIGPPGCVKVCLRGDFPESFPLFRWRRNLR